MSLKDAARNYLAVLANPSHSGLELDGALEALAAATDEHTETKPTPEAKPKAKAAAKGKAKSGD